MTTIIDGTTGTSIAGNATVGGTLGVTSNATVGGTLEVTSNATVGGNLTITGSLTVSGISPQLPLGQGQTWQNVKTTPGRVAGTTYTNTTGRTIVAQVGWVATGAFTSQVDGLVNGEMGGTSAVRAQQTFIIPANSTYLFSGATVDYWIELR